MYNSDRKSRTSSLRKDLLYRPVSRETAIYTYIDIYIREKCDGGTEPWNGIR